MLAVVKVGDGLPSSLIERVADPFDKVMCLVVDASSLKDLFDNLGNYNVYKSISIDIILTFYIKGSSAFRQSC